MKIVRIPISKPEEKQQTLLTTKLDRDPFARIIEIIAPITGSAYWLLEGAIIYKSEETDTIDIVPINVEELVLCHSEDYEIFLLSYSGMLILAPYVAGDWTNVVGIKRKINCEEYDLYTEMGSGNIKVLLQCTDSLYWDVYVFNENIENKLSESFSDATLLQMEKIRF